METINFTEKKKGLRLLSWISVSSERRAGIQSQVRSPFLCDTGHVDEQQLWNGTEEILAASEGACALSGRSPSESWCWFISFGRDFQEHLRMAQAPSEPWREDQESQMELVGPAVAERGLGAGPPLCCLHDKRYLSSLSGYLDLGFSPHF